MFKENKCFKFKNFNDWTVSYVTDFKTESEFTTWMNLRLSEGLVFICEESKIVEQYPQILQLDLKSPGNSYFTLIERFESSNDYKKYCEYKLMQGFKVIGSTPYFK